MRQLGGLDGDVITFHFDPEEKPTEAPAGIYFDLTEAPF